MLTLLRRTLYICTTFPNQLINLLISLVRANEYAHAYVYAPNGTNYLLIYFNTSRGKKAGDRERCSD